jgi:hypothetical protein
MAAYRVEWPAWVDVYAKTVGKTLNRTQSSSAMGGGVCYLFTDTDGSYMEWQAVTSAGTFTLTALYATSNNGGKFQLSVDGANVGALTDGYTAGAVHNNVLFVTGIALTEGVHTIRMAANGKHASSTGFNLFPAWFSLERTGA